MARGASQSMPTLAGATSPPATAPAKPAATLPAPRELRRDEETPTNPLFKSLVWVLVGIGIVGLLLLGVNKYVFNRPVEPSAQTASNNAPASAPEPTAVKPSPVVESPKPPPESTDPP